VQTVSGEGYASSKAFTNSGIRELAGHSNISTTVEFYAETTADQLALAREASNDALLEGAKKQTDAKVTHGGVRKAFQTPRHAQKRGFHRRQRGFWERARLDSNQRPSD
jgi:hypothetical protein